MKDKLKALFGLATLAATAPLFPLSPALSPLVWLASPLWRRASDVAQALGASYYLQRGAPALGKLPRIPGWSLRKTSGVVGTFLLSRELARAGLTEALLRHTPLAGRYGQ